MIANGMLEPMELAHLTYKNGKTYEDYLGCAAWNEWGRKMACARCENREDTKGCPGSRLRGAGRGKQQEIEEAARRHADWEQ